jgi:hypothetical protein
VYDRLSELSLSIGRDQNGLAWRESMEGANCGLHPLIHTLLKFTLAQDIESCQGKERKAPTEGKPLLLLSRSDVL